MNNQPARIRVFRKLKMRRWPAVLGLLALLVAPIGVFAQINLSSPWMIYSRDNGLASNNVLDILPGDGEVWFGTDAGISRFNGEWTTFSPVEGLFTGRVTTLVADAITGKLWAGTDKGDIIAWDGIDWIHIHNIQNAVHALLPIDGQLWIGTDNGLYIWVESAAVPIGSLSDVRVQALESQGNAIWVGTTDGLWIYQRDQWTEITVEDGLPGSDISAIWVDQDGPVWVAANGGIAWRAPSTGIWTTVPTEVLQLTNPARIMALTGDRNGVVWGATLGNGAFRINDKIALEVFSGEAETGLTTPLVQAVAVDQDGLTWFGTQSGVFRYDESMWVKEYVDPIAQPGINRISTIESSIENELWIGTVQAGIRVKFFGPEQKDEHVYTTSNSNLPTNTITALAHDRENTIWAGTHIGVARYNREMDDWETPVPLEVLPSELVTALLAENDHIWIGTEKGLVLYDLVSGSSTVIPELKDRHVKALAVDSLRRLWVGTKASGLYMRRVDGGWEQQIYQLGVEDGMLGGEIAALAADPNTSGGIWVGIARFGINYWDGNEWHDLTSKARLPSKLIYRFYTDPVDGSLWIGSEGGVSRYDGRTWSSLVADNILPSAAVLAIGRTVDGYWFGGRDWLVNYRPDHTKPWVRFERVDGTIVAGDTENIQIETDKEIYIDYTAGDLYSTNDNIAILYRLSSAEQIGSWKVLEDDALVLPRLDIGVVNIEMQARDQAFNYSDVARISLDVVPMPAMVQLPFFAPIRLDYLIALALTSLIALIGSAYVVTEYVDHHRRSKEAVIRGFNPFVSGEPVRRGDMFFGRHDLLQRIVDTLHNNSIMIHGERRIGKTTLLYQLARRLREVDDIHYWFVPLYVDLEGTTEESFFHFLMEEILNGVKTLPEATEEIGPQLTNLLHYHTSDPDYSDREFSRDLRDLIAHLQTYGQQRHPSKQLRIILLLDEMDVMSHFSRIVQQRLRRIFMRDFAATLGAVVAGIQISKDWDRVESPWYNLFNEIELQPFDREQAVELLTQPIEDVYQYEPAALEYIVEQSDGKPYRLQQYALEAVNHMLADRRQRILLEDVEFANEHIERVANDTQTGIELANARNGTHRIDESGIASDELISTAEEATAVDNGPAADDVVENNGAEGDVLESEKDHLYHQASSKN